MLLIDPVVLLLIPNQDEAVLDSPSSDLSVVEDDLILDAEDITSTVFVFACSFAGSL